MCFGEYWGMMVWSSYLKKLVCCCWWI